MAGYTRQSVADIIANAIVKAAPINAEFNAIRNAFTSSAGHKHDGSSDEGGYVPLISDPEAHNKVVIDAVNNVITFFVEVAGAEQAQFRIQDGSILPEANNDINLGNASFSFKDIHIDGVGYIDTIEVHENATVAGTLGVTGLSTLASADINGGTIDGTVIGASSPQAVTGTNITATTGFTGTLTGNVTGNLTGNSAGTHTGAVIGNVTGNVTSTGTSSFTNVNISGSLDMNSGTTATVTGLSPPVNGTDATTKTYVDAADALKLNLSGGTMSGSIAMGTNKITGLGTPTSTADAATKGYVDTSISSLIDAAPGTLDTLNELAAALGDDPNFASTVTTSIATKLPLAGGTMTGDITLGANKATSTATPVTADTLTRKGYVDTQDALKLNLSGGTMSGAIAMGTSKITGLGNPTSAQDAATKTYVDTADALKLSLTGGTMTGAIAMGANKVTSSATPTTDDDLTRKAYVDGILGSATAAATSAAAALVSETNAAGSASAASTSASNASASAAAAASVYDQFDDRYLGSKVSEPTVDNDGDPLVTGALYFNSTTEKLRIYTGSLWQDAGSSVNGTANRVVYTPDAGTTTFNIVYDLGYVDVYLNGVKLVAGSDYTATDGTTVVLTTGTLAGDTVDIIAYGTFTLISVYERDEADATFAKLTGAAFLGDSSVTTNSSSDAFRITQTGTGNALLVEDAASPDASPFVVAGDGNVGLGKTVPTVKLDILNGATAGTALQVATTGAGNNIDMVDATGTVRFRNVNGEMRLYGDLNTEGNGNIIFHPQGTTEAMRIDAAGRVGVGYAPTIARLGVSSTGASPWDYMVVRNTTSGQYTGIGFDGNDTTSNFVINRQDTGGANIAIGPTGHIFLNPDQDSVGIGLPTTETPATKLHVAGNLTVEASATAEVFTVIRNTNTAGTDPDVNLYLDSGNIDGEANVEFQKGGTSYGRLTALQSDMRLVSDTGEVQFTSLSGGVGMRLATSGNVGIGVTTPTEKLDVSGNTKTSGDFITTAGNVYVGKTASSISTVGFDAGSNGAVQATRSGGNPLALNRTSNDGSLIVFFQAGTNEGNISVAGTTVSYNGGHLSRWAQFPDNSRPELLKGTVMSNLDQMSSWDGEDNEQLNCVQVSTVEGDPDVAGVFVAWDSEDDGYNDILLAMTGDMVIRIGAGITVVRGDLLMSAGDGTAKPQGDDIVRSKTIAKVTSTHVSHNYEDGSYAVPCVLMAC